VSTPFLIHKLEAESSIILVVVNDYRGILNRPNLFFKDWTARSPTPSKQSSDQPDDVKSIKYPKKIKGLALYSGAHAIKTGIELCASYGKGWWAHRNS
jgi:hypothetical protein